jgi:hypothetical protein
MENLRDIYNLQWLSSNDRVLLSEDVLLLASLNTLALALAIHDQLENIVSCYWEF